MERSRLRWLAILVPVAIIGGIELLADWALDPYLPFPFDSVVVTASVLILSAILVTIAFRRIGLLNGAVDARNRELMARDATARELHRLSVTIGGTHDLDTILRTVVDGARKLLGAEVAIVILPAPEGASRLAASSGPSDALAHPTAVAGGEPADFLGEPYRRAMLAAPLRSGGEAVGALAVAGRQPRAFDVDDVETLSSLATQLALAIENSRLEGRLREVAVRAERERIAREMHDGLAQVLGYVNTKSQAVEELLADGRSGEARVQLAELAAAARSIYIDVREAILGLTSPVTPERGLVGAVEEYVARFSEASKLATSVRADAGASAVTLAPEVEAQAFRIVQEALTNVRKHAAAQRVAVSMELSGGALLISVSDDGSGIEPDGDPASPAPAVWPHYGLTAMRERASTIGAQITVESQPGTGTTVRLAVPVADALIAARA
jgi:signal transduction histidine kinase